MKVVRSMADAVALAARTGATLDAGGRVLNASGERVTPLRRNAQPATKPEPSGPDAAQVMDAEAVRALLEQRDAHWREQVTHLQAQLAALMGRQQPKPMPWQMSVTYNERGAIVDMVAHPIKEEGA